MSWAAKRRLIYGGAVVILLSIFIGVFFWKVIYKAPTCNDGYKNGDEKGIDCGGGCKNLCTSDALTPIVLWSKIFNISGDVYTAVAYLENPNINSKNSSLKYRFRIFDDSNSLIISKEGETSIPKGKKFAIFENGLVIKNSKPRSAEIELMSFGTWQKDTKVEPSLALKYSALSSTSTIPRITGTITNDSLENIPVTELVVFVLDGNENVVAASQTFVDDLTKRTSQDFVFTWPKPFNLGVEACTYPLDISIALDRSGSMRSEGLFPPEPFSTVTKTAKNFIKNLTNNDQVSVISFGNNSRVESVLTKDKDSAIRAIDNLFLSTTTNEQTNITAGLSDSVAQLETGSIRVESKKVIVLLTDGLPTLPIDPTISDFPTLSAKQVSEAITESKFELFTIGLGKNVSEGFLKSISTDDNHYFLAPTKETLSDIYSKIASSLCQKKPNVINVIYRILN